VKLATIIWHNKLREHGLADKVRQVVHVHDEVQALVKEGYEDQVGTLARQAIREAGERFKLRCPLDGEFKVGKNWHDTH
jgi:DNA polymerase-1